MSREVQASGVIVENSNPQDEEESDDDENEAQDKLQVRKLLLFASVCARCLCFHCYSFACVSCVQGFDDPVLLGADGAHGKLVRDILQHQGKSKADHKRGKFGAVIGTL